MAQTGFTPIQIYFSTTATNVPLNTNLANGELAINSADGKLFYKDSGGAVQTLASQNLLASQVANYVYASPNGSAGVPTFRALVSADIPSLSGTYIPYTGASSAVDLNAKTLVNVANLGVNTTGVPTIRFRAVGDNNSTSRIAMRGYSSDANSSSIRVSKFRGTAGAPQAPISGDSLGKFELAGYGTTSADAYPQVSLEGVTTEVWSATARGAKALIKVTPNTTITQVTAVTVDQDSKVTLAEALAVTGTTTLAASLSGLAKLTSGVVSTATSGTDYAPATSGSSILYGNGAGGFSNVTIGTGVAFAGGTLSATGSGGTVTSVTGTAPVVSSGGATPAISMAAATTSVNGYLTSTDWTTFNNKGSGTVTSVAASVPSIFSIAGSPITSSGTLAITYSGTALPTANGGTNLTSFTANGVVYASSTSALATGSGLTYNGTTLSTSADASIHGVTIGEGLTSTGSNVAIGQSALNANTGGSSVAVGYHAGISATNGGANTFIGSSAGSAMTTGSQNIIIGYNAAASGVGDNFEIVIGPGVTGKGTTTAFISPAGGSVYQGNNAATWAITSDQRLKKNIVDNTTGLSAINAIQVRNFEYRTAAEVTELEAHSAIDIKGVQLGAIAQELQLVLPECVKTESTGVMSVDASNLTWYMINAVKELSAQVTALQAQVSALTPKTAV